MIDLLQFAVDNDMIDLAHIQYVKTMRKRQEYLNQHPYKISQSKNGTWITHLPDRNRKEGRKLIRRGTKEEVEKIVIDYWKQEEENPRIKEIFKEWNDRRADLGKISRATQLRNQQIFNRHFLPKDKEDSLSWEYNSFGERRIKSIEPLEFVEFIEEQTPRFDLTSKAFSNLKGIVKGVIKYSKRKKWISYTAEDVFNELDTSETDFKRTLHADSEEVYTEEEMPKIINELLKKKDLKNLGIILMFVTGMRIGEVSTLKLEDFDENTVRIRRTETRYKMDGKYYIEVKEYPKTPAGVRTIVVPDDYIWIIKSIKEKNPLGEYAFMCGKTRITSSCFRRRLIRTCKLADIPYKSPHKIRKTYGSILLDNHLDNRLIVGQMGHTNVLTTEAHYHRNRRSIENKSKILSALPEFQMESVDRENDEK